MKRDVIWLMVEDPTTGRSVARFQINEHEDGEGNRFDRLAQPQVIGQDHVIDWAVDVLTRMKREGSS